MPMSRRDDDDRAGKPLFKTVIFDVDSTLADIEGIDWLAALRGPEIAAESEALTARAMAGEMPIEAVYTRRLSRIRPTAGELMMLAGAYQQAMQTGAKSLVGALHGAGVQVHLLSGGLRSSIIPFALQLGVRADRVHAVSVTQDTDGTYCLLDGDQPLATQQGKPRVVQQLQLRTPIAMVGDGSTDAAVRGVVDNFYAYTGVARRENVVAVADAEADSFDALYDLLFESHPSRV
ncbi:HAD-IB family phosphatase [Gemmatimonas sp.]|jgi:phosphoserine phosphatase|uniref:HAD-IB family phosphatase n=1 Tax=Gemmatimonas sp. TaxID=1962908 RepID=UPI0037C1166E